MFLKWCQILFSKSLKKFHLDFRSSIRQIIEKRIGLESFNDKLSHVTKSESYSRAIKKPHINYKQASDVFFDHVFVKMFKTVERKFLCRIFLEFTWVLKNT